MTVQPTTLLQPCDAVMSIWTKDSERYFQDLVESVLQRIKEFLKAEGAPTRHLEGLPNKVARECILYTHS